MVNNKSDNVTSSATRMRKSRELQRKRDKAALHGIKLYEECLVIEYDDGYIEVQQWNGVEWVALLHRP